jgi:hypothetical protein
MALKMGLKTINGDFLGNDWIYFDCILVCYWDYEGESVPLLK